MPEDVGKIEEEAEKVPEINNDDLDDDNEGDRDYSYNLVGQRIWALYNNGQFTGQVKYFNTRNPTNFGLKNAITFELGKILKFCTLR